MIGILESELDFWPEFNELGMSEETAVIQDSDLSLWANWRRIPKSISIMRRFRDMPQRHAFVASQILDRGVRVLITTDRPISVLNSLSETCRLVHQILVAHTTIQPLNTQRLRETHPFERRNLLVWGSRDAKLVRAIQPKFEKIQIVGSLRNASYLRRRPREEQTKLPRICVISSYLGVTKEESRKSKPNDPRFVLRERLIELAKLASNTQDLPIHIAMKPATMTPFDVDAKRKFLSEQEYFQSKLSGLAVSFNDPQVRYATYESTDTSSLVVGLPTGAFIEALGRGCRALTLGTAEFEEFSSMPTPFSSSQLSGESIRSAIATIRARSSRELHSIIRPWIDFGTEPRAYDVLRALALTLSS